MLIFNSPKGYGAIPQAIHWLTAILVVAAWILGLVGDDLPKGTLRDAGLSVHISAGLVVIILLVVRLAWNFFNPAPSAGSTILGVWLARVGHVAHYLLYVLLFAVPIAGFVLRFAGGESIPIFGLYEIASPLRDCRRGARSSCSYLDDCRMPACRRSFNPSLDNS